MNIGPEQVFLVNSELEPRGFLPAPAPTTYTVPAAPQSEDPSTSSMCLPVSVDAPRAQMCRLCATVTDMVIPIFEGEGLQNGLAEKINQHLPIKVNESDTLPLVVCCQCCSTILAWHELVQCSLQADAAMRQRLFTQNETQSKVQINDTSVKPEKSRIKVIRTALTEYLQLINMDEQVLIICEKCHTNPTFNREGFILHMAKKHILKQCSKDDVISFIKDNVMIAETILFDADFNGDTGSNTSDVPEDTDTVKENYDTKNSPEFAKKITQKLTNEILERDSQIPQSIKHANEQTNIEATDPNPEAAIPDPEPEIEFLEEDTDVECEARSRLPALLCPHCRAAFSSASRLLHHLAAHRPPPLHAGLQCCGATYRTKREFVQHLQETHVNRLIYDPATLCRSCGHSADTPRALARHVRACHAPPERKKQQQRSTNNQKYIPAKCPQCDRTFSNKYNMRAHLAAHGAHGAHACHCGRRYSTRGNLRQHVRLAHAGRLPHACDACGERFPTRAARDLHARLHTGARPHVCALCGAAFRARDSLRRHLDAHLDVRNYSCTLCSKAFRKSSHLAAHARTHGGPGAADSGTLARHGAREAPA